MELTVCMRTILFMLGRGVYVRISITVRIGPSQDLMSGRYDIVFYFQEFLMDKNESDTR
jgi:hypothetical protein